MTASEPQTILCDRTHNREPHPAHNWTDENTPTPRWCPGFTKALNWTVEDLYHDIPLDS